MTRAGGLGADFRYPAFISYSHRDEAIARWLHRALESYRVPNRLVGTAALRGPVPARLSPIFRDREELSAATDLSAEVRRALGNAESLIVLCSPNAAASTWVAREIEAFQAMHPDRPVLLALAAGEPAQAFPSAVTARIPEPLAADLRKIGDGRRLGLLKIIAGVLGLPLNTLAQRDAQRRQRRVMAVTLTTILAMLVLALLLVLALRARDEANRQRREAEGLVEYMLTDLRDRLRGVGRLDVMTAVNERALAYYGGQQNLADLPAASLERRARILQAMGEDDETRGETGRALAKFIEAHRSTATLLADAPNDPERVFAHAQSEYWVGYAAYLAGYKTHRKSGAFRHFEAYRRLADRLVALDPRNPRSTREVGYAEGNLCSLFLAPPIDASRAVASCATALGAMQRTLAMTPDERGAIIDVINREAWLADAYAADGDIVRAVHHRDEQARMLAGLIAADPRNRELQDTWLTSQIALADLEAKQNRIGEARGRLTAAVAIAEQVVAFDPANKQWRQRRDTIASRLAGFDLTTTGGHDAQ